MSKWTADCKHKADLLRQSTKCGADATHAMRCDNCGEVLKEPSTADGKAGGSIRLVCDNCGQTHNVVVPA